MAPHDVTNQNEGSVRTKLYGKRLKSHPLPKLKVGDRVRLSKKHCPFKKGYLPGWTEEVFVVQRVVPGPESHSTRQSLVPCRKDFKTTQVNLESPLDGLAQ